VPITALTATATSKVREDILKLLGMRSARVFKVGRRGGRFFWGGGGWGGSGALPVRGQSKGNSNNAASTASRPCSGTANGSEAPALASEPPSQLSQLPPSHPTIVRPRAPQTSFHRPNLIFRVVPKVERAPDGEDEAPCMTSLIRCTGLGGACKSILPRIQGRKRGAADNLA
jgi:superfamily II DNA helicase RecQ